MLIVKTCLVLVFCYNIAADQSQTSISLSESLVHKNLNKNYRNLGNHPPLFETFDNVPIEDDEVELEKVRKEKSISEDKQTGLRELFNKDEIDSTTIKYSNRLNKKSSLSPVATVDSINVTKLSSSSSQRRLKQRRRQRIPEKEKSLDKNSINVTVSLNDTKAININNGSIAIANQPRSFPKRPAQFNPVFKKRTREKDPVVKIIRERNNVYAHTGNFHYSFEGGDGTLVSSQGELKSFKDKTAGEAVSGSVFYKDNEGKDVSLTYTADENGYRPIGDHLPTSPPIPPEIARALAYLATKSTPQPVTEAYNTDY